MNKFIFIAVLRFLCATSPLLAVAAPEPATLRNPFKPVSAPQAAIPPTNLPPLRRYPINELKLTAIIRNSSGELYASIEDPNGIGFKVVRGSVIGDVGATVIDITPLGIAIEEPPHSTTNTPTPLIRREIRLHKPIDSYD